MAIYRLSLGLLVVALGVTTAFAGDCCGQTQSVVADSGCVATAPQCVEKTVCVPQWVKVKKTVMCTQYVPTVKKKTINVCRRVPVTKPVTTTCTVWERQERVRNVTCTVCEPKYEPRECTYQVRVPVTNVVDQTYWTCQPVVHKVDQPYTVMVPRQVEVKGVRTVCRVVQETEMRKVTCDKGHWDTCIEEVPCRPRCRLFRRCGHKTCGTCGDCGTGCDTGCGECDATCQPTRTVCRKVWVPNIVTTEVPVTVCRTVQEKVPYTCMKTVCDPVVKHRTVCVTEYQRVQKTRKVNVCSYKIETHVKKYTVCKMVPKQVVKQVRDTVCVPRQVTRTVNVTTCETVTEPKEIEYTVCVPTQVERQVDVWECQMVEKKIQVPVATGCCESTPCCRTRKVRCHRARRRNASCGTATPDCAGC